MTEKDAPPRPPVAGEAEPPAPSPNRAPRMSLVVATLGRTCELERLFDSLAVQTMMSFEVVVVDQNDDDRLAPLTQEQQWPFSVRRIHTPGERGACRARNRGWRAAVAPLLLFPDDDCWFSPDFLEQAVTLMDRLEYGALGGRLVDEDGRVINARFERTAQDIDRANVWTTAIEAMVVFRREVLEATNGFDEMVGVGAATPWQAAEIQDILLRAIELGFTCRFDPSLAGHHDEIVVGEPNERVRRKARGYARGMGYVLRRHHYGWLSVASWLVRPTGGLLLSLATGRVDMARYYGQMVLGRIEGARARTFNKGELGYGDWTK